MGTFSIESTQSTGCCYIGEIGGTEGSSTPLHDTDDFLRNTYKSLFDQERKRGQPSKKRRKVHTALTFVEPQSLFTEGDVLAGIVDQR